MKTKVKPTVEKWEDRLVLWITECDLAQSTKPLANHIRTLLASSVQEAKAERDKFWNTMLDGVQDAYGEWYKDRLTKLASLKQEEGK